MICPKCGNNVSLFADKCLSCGKNFKSMSFEERQKLEIAQPVKKVIRKSRPRKTKPKAKVKRTEVITEFNNGYAIKEGMSINGGKKKRGAHRPFLFKY